MRLAGIKWKQSLFIWSKQVSCLSSYLLPIHKKNHTYPTDSQYSRNNFRLHLSQWISTGNRLLKHVWLLLLGNISSKLSTIIDYFEIPTFIIDEQTQILVNPLSFQCHLYQDNLVLPQLKQLFLKGCLLQWNRDVFLENKSRKIKLVSKCSLLDFTLCLLLRLCRKSCNKSKSNW